MNEDIIRLLPDSVANQIAAGEVIQRPASVIKELVENAVDAGATRVEIILRDAGRTLVQVVDNGCGMSATDARMAFERHATSKITAASDLLSLHTMGFRGEALASIAAVAQVELRTMRASDPVGTRIVISGSQVESQEPMGCTPGCNMMVKNLFYNVPARRKFLKKDSAELAHIMHEFERLALVNCGVEFSISHNGTLLHQLLPGTFHRRICELFGKSLEKQLLPVATSTSIVEISGYVGRPENARRRGALQYLMVNGRNMRHPFFHKAILDCYAQLIPADEQPSYFINLMVDPDSIDVNIHPQKHEIKFENEVPIRQIIVAAVRETLGRFNAVPSIDFESTDLPDIPAFSPDPTRKQPQISVDPSYNPFKAEKSEAVGLDSLEGLYESFADNRSRGYESARSSALNSLDLSTLNLGDDCLRPDAPTLPMAEPEEVATASLQLNGRYIVSPMKAGLMIVDQHRAQVKILFDRFIKECAEGTFTMQRLMFPQIVTLSASQSAVIEAELSRLSSIGFDLAYVGDTSWVVNGIPSEMEGVDATELIVALADSLVGEDESPVNVANERIALAMARRKAVRPGQQLRPEEMDKILADLLRLSSPGFTPDGKRVYTVIATDEIGRMLE